MVSCFHHPICVPPSTLCCAWTQSFVLSQRRLEVFLFIYVVWQSEWRWNHPYQFSSPRWLDLESTPNFSSQIQAILFHLSVFCKPRGSAGSTPRVLVTGQSGFHPVIFARFGVSQSNFKVHPKFGSSRLNRNLFFPTRVEPAQETRV